ncbi:MAG: UbiA-like polyprenyltransferase [Desulfovibrionaceae bacterium]
MTSAAESLKLTARMIKIEHSVFALPFAYMGAFLAARGWPGFFNLLVLTIAMVAVRSFAMTVNRLADRKIDADNPRTQDRPLVTGELSPRFAGAFAAGCAFVFAAACALMNPLCLKLAPLALAVSAFYSFTKRFTWLCHFALGLVLGLAPVAGWLCVTPRFHLAQALLLLGGAFWVAGFDILYASQDLDFDRSRGLHSVPARFGLDTALAVSAFCHVNTALFFLLAGAAAGLGWVYCAAVLAVCGVLVWEHTLFKPDDLSRVNLAFFTLNGVIAVGLFAGLLLDLHLA